MKLFIDTGLVEEVEEIAAWGVLSGATTNPSLLAKADGDPGDIIRRICDLVDGPTSAEVVATDAEGMITEGRALARPARPRRGEGAVLAGGASGHARAHLRRHPGEHDAGVLRRAGDPHRRGRRHLRLLLHGPRRRHLGRRHRGARGDRRRAARRATPRCWPPRCATRCTRSPPPRSAATCRPFPPRCSSRCSCTRSPPQGIDQFAADWQSDPRSRSGSRGSSRAPRRAPSAPARTVGLRAVPVLQRKELEESPLADLHAIASELGIEGYRALRQGRAGQGDPRGAGRARGGSGVEVASRSGVEDEPEPEEPESEDASREASPSARSRPSPSRVPSPRRIRSPACSTFFPTAVRLPPGRRRRGRRLRLARPDPALRAARRRRGRGAVAARRGATSAIRRSSASRPSTAATPSRPRSGRCSSTSPRSTPPSGCRPGGARRRALRQGRRAWPSAAGPAPAPPACCARSSAALADKHSDVAVSRRARGRAPGGAHRAGRATRAPA